MSYMFFDYNQTYQDPEYTESGRLCTCVEGVLIAYIFLFQFYCKPNIDLKPCNATWSLQSWTIAVIVEGDHEGWVT